MRIPTEGELIEMQAKFDVLAEMAYVLRGKARDEREDHRFADAEELEFDAAVLVEVSELADSLLDLVRSQMAVPR